MFQRRGTGMGFLREANGKSAWAGCFSFSRLDVEGETGFGGAVPGAESSCGWDETRMTPVEELAS